MNKLLSAILLLTLSGVSVNGLADDHEETEEEPGGGKPKVELCHKGKKTIMVGAPALNAHLGHGDVGGSCEESTEPGEPPEGSDRVAAVVTMHCEAIEGTVQWTAFSSSVAVELLDIDTPLTNDCAEWLAALINGGFMLRSVTGATDYLLLGEAPEI